MDRFRRALSGDEEENQDEEESLLEGLNDEMSLSWSNRIRGFVVCFVFGVLCSLMGSAFLAIPFKGKKLFAVFYTFGNILSLASTCFLMGPCNQCKKMFAETRIFATIIVFVCIILTFLSAFWWDKTGLAILFCIFQFISLTWYSLSYIPFARDAVKRCFQSCIG